MCIIKDLKSERALSARTSGDPRILSDDPVPATTLDPLDSPSTAFCGRFMGFGNNKAVMLVLIITVTDGITSYKLRRAHHALVDEFGLSANPTDKPLPNELILSKLYDSTFRPAKPIEWKFDPLSCDLDTMDSPYDPSICESFQVILPPSGQTIGMELITDEDYLVPILVRIDPAKPIYNHIPLRHHFCTSWIISIEDHQPLTARGAQSILKDLQRVGEPVMITIGFCPMNDPERKTYEYYRSIFDSHVGVPQAPVNSPTTPAPALHLAQMATLSKPPINHGSIWNNLEGPERTHWIQATATQYSKNQVLGLCAVPAPRELVPSDKKVLQSILATKIKPKGNDIFEFVTRMCANGSSQVKSVDFDHSWSPTVGAGALRMTLMFAATHRLILAVIDVVNCFQTTLVEDDERLIITCPPFYLSWFKRNYPEINLLPSASGKYVLEIQRGLQGDKSIGRKWYLLVKRLLEKFGFVQCHPEPAVYKYEKDGITMIVNTSTDDFLCAYSHESIYIRLCTFFKGYFNITTKDGAQLAYLNLRIIQSTFGISYDQTEHIQDTIVDKYFPPSTTSTLKTVHTPFRTDNQFEIDLCEDLPATPAQLKLLIARYGGSYGEIIGQLMHIFVWTRNDLGFSCTRFSRYIQAASATAFAGIYRTLRYLATHSHRPIMYPRSTVDGYHTLRVDFDPPVFKSIELPNGLILVLDADHARDNRTRKSCSSILALILGVCIDWKMEQQKCVAIHSTDSETRCVFAGIKRGIALQDVAEFIGFDSKAIYPTPIYEDSQPCIDILEANTVTTRVKHIATPIHFIHSEIGKGKFIMRKIDTSINLADSGTKPTSSPVHFRQFNHTIGVRFYPPTSSEHGKLLQLDKFLKSPFITSKPPTQSSGPSATSCNES